ncbi:MAG: DUF2330 domain-containing protein [Planctomycetes bacterium]|nr:DUF2330 domain-containing protein [Planctomycetota bacterium]
MFRIAGLLVLALCLLTPPAQADKGLVPLKPATALFQPNQRAVIAWNGKEELLILSPPGRVSPGTKFVQILPLPARPTISAGNVRVFHTATERINATLSLQGRSPVARPVRTVSYAGPGGGVELATHSTIAGHDISLVQVDDPRKFVGWLEEVLRQRAVAEGTVTQALKADLMRYVRDGFRWFLIDVVETDRETAVEPVKVRFATDRLYYPLRILQPEEGSAPIQLLVLSPRLIAIPAVPPAKIHLRHEPVKLSSEDLKYLDDDLKDLLGDDPVLLRIWEISGRAAAVKRDIVTGWW